MKFVSVITCCVELDIKPYYTVPYIYDVINLINLIVISSLVNAS